MNKTERLKALEYWCALIQKSAERGDAKQAIVQLTGALSLWANQYAPTDREARAIYAIVEACKSLFPVQPPKEVTFSEVVASINLQTQDDETELLNHLIHEKRAEKRGLRWNREKYRYETPQGEPIKFTSFNGGWVVISEQEWERIHK